MAKLYGWKCDLCQSYTGFFRETDDGECVGETTPPHQCSCGCEKFIKEDLTYDRNG